MFDSSLGQTTAFLHASGTAPPASAHCQRSDTTASASGERSGVAAAQGLSHASEGGAATPSVDQHALFQHLLDVAGAASLREVASAQRSGGDGASCSRRRGAHAQPESSITSKHANGAEAGAAAAPPRHASDSGEPSGEPLRSSDASAAAPASGGFWRPELLSRKPRFIWSDDLHRSFVHAVASIGLRQATPKLIMQILKEAGLTREIVASHLQKYRLTLKKRAGLAAAEPIADADAPRMLRAQDDYLSSLAGEPPSLSGRSAATFQPAPLPCVASAPCLEAPPGPCRDAAPTSSPLLPAHVQTADATPPPPFARSTDAAPDAVLAFAAAPLAALGPSQSARSAASATGVCAIQRHMCAPSLSNGGLPPGMYLPPPDANGVAIGLPMPFPLCMQHLAQSNTPRPPQYGDTVSAPPAMTSPAASPASTPPGGPFVMLPLPGKPSSLMPAGFTPAIANSNLHTMRQLNQQGQVFDAQPVAPPPASADAACPASAPGGPTVEAPPATMLLQQQRLVYVPMLAPGADPAAAQQVVMLNPVPGSAPQLMFSVSMAAYHACQSLPMMAALQGAQVNNVLDGLPVRKADSSLSTAPTLGQATGDVSSRRRDGKRRRADLANSPETVGGSDSTRASPGMDPRGGPRRRRDSRSGQASSLAKLPSLGAATSARASCTGHAWAALPQRDQPRGGSSSWADPLGVLAAAAASVEQADGRSACGK